MRYHKWISALLFVPIVSFVSADSEVFDPHMAKENMSGLWENQKLDDYMQQFSAVQASDDVLLSDQERYRAALIELVRSSNPAQALTHLDGTKSEVCSRTTRWLQWISAAQDMSVYDDRFFRTEFRAILEESHENPLDNFTALDLGRRSMSHAKRLSSSHPESALRIAAEIAAEPLFGIYAAEANHLTAVLTNTNIQAARDSLSREQAANEAHIRMMQMWRSGREEEAILQARSLIAAFPGTNTSTVTHLRIAYFLINQGDYEEAIAEFQNVLTQSRNSDEGSLISKEAEKRIRNLKIATNYKEAHKIPKAQVLQEVLAYESKHPEDLDAQLQAAGTYFEVIQNGIISGDGFPPEYWEEMIGRLQTIASTGGPLTAEHATAELMLLEAAYWRRDSDEVTQRYYRLHDLFSDEEYRIQLFTGSYFAGLQALHDGDHNRVVEILEEAVAGYESDEEPWYGLELLEDAHVKLVESYMALGEKQNALNVLADLSEIRPDSQRTKYLSQAIEKGYLYVESTKEVK